jgi:Na+-translocating ferredoxin:NAD+ oxidoreductase subunit B
VIAVERVDALLPQTQCTRCGYIACLPYARAILDGEADINQCPPGGASTIDALARLLGIDPKPLNPVNGVESAQRVAWIDAERCIGCAKCLAPCPVDAILGAAKFLHTVLIDRCTGCDLCVAPCPVDCIEMRLAPADFRLDPDLNRERFTARNARIAADAHRRALDLQAKKAAVFDRRAD